MKSNIYIDTTIINDILFTDSSTATILMISGGTVAGVVVLGGATYALAAKGVISVPFINASGAANTSHM